MFRIEESRRRRVLTIAVPVALAVASGSLATLSAIVISHLGEERALIEAAARGELAEGDALRALGPLVARDLPLVTAALVPALAVVIAAAAGYGAYARAQRRLRELKIFAADVLESVSAGVVTLDLAGHVTAMNARAAKLMGVDPARTRRHYSEVFEGAPVLCDAAEKLLVRATPFRNLEVSTTQGGIGRAPGGGGNPSESPATLSLDGSFLETQDGRRIGAVIQLTDATELKRIEAEVRRSEQLASLGTLAAGLAHEIRNPLAALDINVQLLAEAIAARRAEVDGTRYARVIEAEIRRLDEIVANFIRFARSRPVERAPVDLARLVEDTLDLVEPECRKQRVEVERSGLEADLPAILGDESELTQAVLNIVLNAVQAMPEGGTLAVAIESGTKELRLSVRDTGPGIPVGARERIFDLFYTTRDRGTGLGLPIAKKIVSANGGGLAFETGAAGTTFILTFPLAPPGSLACVSRQSLMRNNLASAADRRG